MKRLFLFLVAIVVCGTLSAHEVTPERASMVAQRLLSDNATRYGAVSLVWDSSRLGSTRANEAPSFYVFAKSDMRGFVIVAGDDVLPPVLAYSLSYPAPESGALPPCFEAWLKYVDSSVRYAREHGLVPRPSVVRRWSEEYAPQNATMLNTARWSQTEPYNLECPMDDGALSLTGCTQTAVAIIMKHHRWPERAVGTTTAYTTITKSIYVPERDLNHAYDWDNMLETYVEGEYNDVEAQAVATLMADLGHSFMADYAALGTGANPSTDALYRNYGYSPASNIFMRQNYSDSYWNDMLRREIEAGNPVWYSGFMADYSGHAFVLDGIDDNNYYHVNWGWGGVYDGFFTLDALILGEYEFDYGQYALLNFEPLRGDAVDNWLTLYSTGIELGDVEFTKGAEFDINSILISNVSSIEFSGSVRVAHCDKEGRRKEWVSEAKDFSVPPQYYGYVERLRCKLTDSVEEGDRLRVFYSAAGSDEWFVMYPYTEGATWDIVMRYAPIGATTSFDYDKLSQIIVVDYDDDVKSALYCGGSYIEDGVEIVRGKMTINTARLAPGSTYTVLLVRDNVEERTFTFTIKPHE
ncbi:MAG: C10 family peptidase [Alistipes sp.]|nr:C10 family peptidase [Alistipes sp.]